MHNTTHGTEPIEPVQTKRGQCSDPVTHFEVTTRCPRCYPEPPIIVAKVDPRLPDTSFCLACGHTWLISRAVVKNTPSPPPQKNRYKKTCPVCGIDFETYHKNQLCCSRECAAIPRESKKRKKQDLSTI